MTKNYYAIKLLSVLAAFILLLVLSAFILTSCSTNNDEDTIEICEDTPPHAYMLGDFPTLRITTPESPFLDRNTWQNGQISVTDAAQPFLFNNAEVRVRGRGNSTWRFGYQKKPLRFRFPEARYMLDSATPHRDWVLISNHFDRGLLRNYVALNLGATMENILWTPYTRMVHLYVNNEYMGVYQLADERTAEPGRANLTFNENPALSDFFIELDWHSHNNRDLEPGVDYFVVGPRAYDLRWPNEDDWNGHLEYAEDYITRVSAAITSQDWDAITALIDVPSFVDFYIVQELMKNVDVGWFSVFMTIQGQGQYRRLYMGPLWDFDQSAGISDNQVIYAARSPYPVYSPYGLLAGEYNYWFRYLLGTPQFFAAVTERWNEIKDNQIADVIALVRYMADTYNHAFQRNFVRHPIFTYQPSWFWVNPVHVQEIENFDGQVDYLIDFLTARVGWLDSFFNRH